MWGSLLVESKQKGGAERSKSGATPRRCIDAWAGLLTIPIKDKFPSDHHYFSAHGKFQFLIIHIELILVSNIQNKVLNNEYQFLQYKKYTYTS